MVLWTCRDDLFDGDELEIVVMVTMMMVLVMVHVCMCVYGVVDEGFLYNSENGDIKNDGDIDGACVCGSLDEGFFYH